MSVSQGACETIGELLEAAVSQAVGALGELCGATIHHTAPQVVHGQPDQARQLFPAGQATREKLVVLDFGGGLGGVAVLALPHDSCDALTGLLGAQLQRLGAGELDPDALLGELGNVLLNGVIGSIANTFGISIVAPVPEVVSDQSVSAVLASHRSVRQNPEQGVFLSVTPFHADELEVGGALVVLFDPASMMRVLSPRLAAV